MKGSPIYQNLSTSFVDLSMLIRFLRDRRFTGSVRIEWEGYDGEIFFTRSPRLQAREYDRSIGRIAQGQKAFHRILQRSLRPSGRIRILKRDPERIASVLKKAFVDERIIAQAHDSAFGKAEQLAPLTSPLPQRTRGITTESTRAALLATDLLLTFKEAFEKTRIGFDTAFALACEFETDRFPFLDPDRNEFSFYKDEIFISSGIAVQDLFAGLVEALRHMISRLAGEERLLNSIIYLRHRLHLHLSSRDNDYRDLQLTEIVDHLLD